MKASLLLFTAATLWWRSLVQNPVESTSSSELDCRSHARRLGAEAVYRVWQSVHVRAGSSSVTRWCGVNLNMTTSSTRQEPGRQPQLLLLVKVESLGLNPSWVFYMSMSNTSRWSTVFCHSGNCDANYMWVGESVQLSFYFNSLVAEASYEAAFVATEATNVCGLVNRVGDLLVGSSDGSIEYAFASDVRHKALPPNNIECTADSEYSLTVRQDVSSALLTVTVLACPSQYSCASLLLNQHRCREGEIWVAQQPGYNVTLQYMLQRGCTVTMFTGFVVSARAGASTEQRSSLRTLSTSGARSWTSKTFTSSSAPDSTAGNSGLDASRDADASTLTVVAASVSALTAIAVVIGVTVVCLCRKRRRRRRRRRRSRSSTSQAVQSSALDQAQNAASAGDEIIAMVGNDLYGVTLARSMTADQ